MAIIVEFISLNDQLGWVAVRDCYMTDNCRIHHVTFPIATRILIANVKQIGLSNVCVINLVYFKMQV